MTGTPRRGARLERAADLEAVDARKPHVQDDERRGLRRGLGKRLLAGLDAADAIALGLERDLEDGERLPLIVDDEEPGRLRLRRSFDGLRIRLNAHAAPGARREQGDDAARRSSTAWRSIARVLDYEAGRPFVAMRIRLSSRDRCSASRVKPAMSVATAVSCASRRESVRRKAGSGPSCLAARSLPLVTGVATGRRPSTRSSVPRPVSPVSSSAARREFLGRRVGARGAGRGRTRRRYPRLGQLAAAVPPCGGPEPAGPRRLGEGAQRAAHPARRMTSPASAVKTAASAAAGTGGVRRSWRQAPRRRSCVWVQCCPRPPRQLACLLLDGRAQSRTPIPQVLERGAHAHERIGSGDEARLGQAPRLVQDELRAAAAAAAAAAASASGAAADPQEPAPRRVRRRPPAAPAPARPPARRPATQALRPSDSRARRAPARPRVPHRRGSRARFARGRAELLAMRAMSCMRARRPASSRARKMPSRRQPGEQEGGTGAGSFAAGPACSCPHRRCSTR